MEILSPAGSYAALKAAVENGADAVYMGAPQFNARVNAQNFTDEEFKNGIELCKKNGVKVYAVLNTLIFDNEFKQVLTLGEKLTELGVDAFIVQDLGLAEALKKCTAGSVPLHASTQMSIGNLDGVMKATELGFTRAVLARELSKKDIEYIAKNSPIELEIFVHGALCVCYSGQCRMSSVIGNRSGNRGACAQPCRLPYERGYSLSLKDNCLLEYVRDFEDMGIASLKIEGRMKGPAYVGAVTAAYANAKRGETYTESKKDELAKIFSRDGFTDGYYLNKMGKPMFGVRKETETIPPYVQPEKEYKRFAVDFNVISDENRNIIFSATDSENHSAEVSIIGEKAANAPTGEEQLKKNLGRLGGTPYELRNLHCDTKDNFIPASKINDARRQIINCLDSMKNIKRGSFTVKLPQKNNYDKAEKTEIEAQFTVLKNVICDNRISRIWLPLTAVKEKRFTELFEFYKEKTGLVLPMIIRDENRREIKNLIETALNSGVKDFLCGNIGHIYALSGYDANLYGDTGLNVTNAFSKDAYLNMGIKNVTLSFELNMRKIQDLADEKSGIIAYGRLPFMTMRNCIKGNGHGCENKNKPYYLKDRMNKTFLVTCGYDCANDVWNSDKLWLADKDLPQLSFKRLLFTDETSGEVKEVVDAYAEKINAEREMKNLTRGLYYR
ncbi:MAG: U32 family peptidase [Clostridia bacterium]|nr:U32 family peptidase [Clostridia bacterium]